MTAPRDPDYDQRVRASFARQAAMATIGASVTVSVVSGDLRAIEGAGAETGALVAIMTATMMTVRDRPGMAD